jgi:formate dehydrogenase subunit gamma
MGRGEARPGAAPASDWDEAVAGEIIAAHLGLEGAMLPILHALQGRFGCVDPRAVTLIAEALNLSRAEVHGTLPFYHDFRETPPGRHVVKLCRAEACQSMGCDALADHLAREHGLAMGDTTPDGRLTVEAVYCLGNCALSPAALVDGDLVGRLDKARLDGLVHDLTGGRA